MPYIPHTQADKDAMLAAIGVSESKALFSEIPADLLYSGLEDIPEGLSEMAMLREAQAMAARNQNGVCFMGAGAYEHHIPAAVWDVATRGEYLTAYTPYQAEASQGTLQLLYEYQTMIAELTGMEVANASMYDGATALAEAALMALRLNKQAKSNRILLAGTVHPYYRETLITILKNQQIEVLTLEVDAKTGTTDPAVLRAYEGSQAAALIIPQPNFLGCLEEVDALTDWAHDHQMLSIAVVNPIAMALITPPGQWGREGVDIVCGEGQPLGVPLASGGPYFGFLSTRMAHVRQMPGRIIGRTLDKSGKTGFTLTLQAREQHIRRGKATSNICTNQGLLVTAATIYMSIMGAEGLRQVALSCHQNTAYLTDCLSGIKGLKKLFTSPYFHEVVFELPCPVAGVVEDLASAGILAGLDLSPFYPQFGQALLICATEMRTQAEIEAYAQALQTSLNKRGV